MRGAAATNRYLEYRYAEDGSLVLTAQLPAEAGVLLIKALDAALPEVSELESMKFESRDVSAETSVPRVPVAVQRADALGVMAESFLKHGVETLSGGDRHQIVVHIDADTLRERTAGCCELKDGPALAAETARRFACDASVVALIENAQGEPLDVGRKTRTISPALRRALNARDQGCRFPGCCNQRYVDAHHIRHGLKAVRPSCRISRACANFTIARSMRRNSGAGLGRWRATVCES